MVTKLKNSNCDKIQKPKLCQNSKNHILTKLKNIICDKNKKNLILTKLKNSNCHPRVSPYKTKVSQIYKPNT